MKTWKFKKGYLVNGDCTEVLRRVKPQSVDLVFADPPFNIGYAYDVYKDKKDKDQYLTWTKVWLNLCRLALKPTGSIFVAIGDEYAAEIKTLLDRCGFTMRNWIIWNYNFGVYCKTKFGRDHAHILYYSVDRKNRTFNAEDVLVPSARQTRYNDKRAESGGRVPSDVWNYPRVCGTFKERNDAGHKCQMPEELLERVIKVASRPGELVLDPFAGTGTTAAVAARLKRKFLTCELSGDYSRHVARRLARHTKLLKVTGE